MGTDRSPSSSHTTARSHTADARQVGAGRHKPGDDRVRGVILRGQQHHPPHTPLLVGRPATRRPSCTSQPSRRPQWTSPPPGRPRPPSACRAGCDPATASEPAPAPLPQADERPAPGRPGSLAGIRSLINLLAEEAIVGRGGMPALRRQPKGWGATVTEPSGACSVPPMTAVRYSFGLAQPAIPSTARERPITSRSARVSGCWAR